MALSTPSTGGTWRWMAPELLRSDDAGGTPHKPSKESDVHSFGMVAYEVSVIIASSLTVTYDKKPARSSHTAHLTDTIQTTWSFSTSLLGNGLRDPLAGKHSGSMIHCGARYKSAGIRIRKADQPSRMCEASSDQHPGDGPLPPLRKSTAFISIHWWRPSQLALRVCIPMLGATIPINKFCIFSPFRRLPRIHRDFHRV